MVYLVRDKEFTPSRFYKLSTCYLGGTSKYSYFWHEMNQFLIPEQFSEGPVLPGGLLK